MTEDKDLNEINKSIEVNRGYISLCERLLNENLSSTDRDEVNYHLDYLKFEEQIQKSKKEACLSKARLSAISTKEEMEKFEAEQKLPIEEQIKNEYKEMELCKQKIKVANIFCYFPLKRIRTNAGEVKKSYEGLLAAFERKIKALESLKTAKQKNLERKSEYDQNEAKFYQRLKEKNPTLDDKLLLEFATNPKLYTYTVLEMMKKEYFYNPLEGEYDFLNPDEQQ
ncbi:hypothetical protein HZA97_06690 [Candidatus Woesearchaeota archaeon]|nr:hypothetical protein [Candidatus Woesearchaeota archaeon]